MGTTNVYDNLDVMPGKIKGDLSGFKFFNKGGWVSAGRAEPGRDLIQVIHGKGNMNIDCS
jgi:hypothetical protein